jgi:hypothetical protein
LGDVDGRGLRFCGRFAKGYSGAVFAAATKEGFGPVRFELFFGSFSLQQKSYCCHRNGARDRSRQKPRWYVHGFPNSASLYRDLVYYSPK